MGEGENRPRASAEPPKLDQSRERLAYLLGVEMERLSVAVRIEKERKIVFPETSVIIHDIMRIQMAMDGKGGKNSKVEGEWERGDWEHEVITLFHGQEGATWLNPTATP